MLPPQTSCKLLAAVTRPYSQQHYNANLAWAGLQLIAHRFQIHKSPTTINREGSSGRPSLHSLHYWHALPGADVPIITKPLPLVNFVFLYIFDVACAVSWSYTTMLQRTGRQGHLHPQSKVYAAL